MSGRTGTILDFSWSNDGMNYFVPAKGLSRGRILYDDDGFTNDFAAQVSYQSHRFRYFLKGIHRMITERGGLRRIDEARLEGGIEGVVRQTRRSELRSFAGLGVVATGPLGGAFIQDRVHRLIRWGRTLSGDQQGQLQDTYEGGVRASPLLRVGGEMSLKVRPTTRLSAGSELSFSPKTGASYAQLALEGEQRWPVGRAEIAFSSALRIRHLRSEEQRLSFEGGYPSSKTFLEPEIGVSYHRGATSTQFSLILNVEGTGAHQGSLSFRYFLGH